MAEQVKELHGSRAYIPNLLHDIRQLDEMEKTRRQRITRTSGAQLDAFKVLTLANVTYAYPDTDAPAVDDLSLELKRGESIGFVGATGCGKSTLINLILGLLGAPVRIDQGQWRRYLQLHGRVARPPGLHSPNHLPAR